MSSADKYKGMGEIWAREHASGLTLDDIAERHGASRASVSRGLKRIGYVAAERLCKRAAPTPSPGTWRPTAPLGQGERSRNIDRDAAVKRLWLAVGEKDSVRIVAWGKRLHVGAVRVTDEQCSDWLRLGWAEVTTDRSGEDVLVVTKAGREALQTNE